MAKLQRVLSQLWALLAALQGPALLDGAASPPGGGTRSALAPDSLALESGGQWRPVHEEAGAPAVVRRERAGGNSHARGRALEPESAADGVAAPVAGNESDKPQSSDIGDIGEKLKKALVDKESSSVASMPTVGDSVTKIKNPPIDESQLAIYQEQNRECLREETVAACMERLGSYTIRRLQDPKSAEHFKYADWMSNGNVQKQRLLNITLPGTHVSAAYGFKGEQAAEGAKMGYGILTQKHSILRQLEVGIRYFDIRVAWGPKDKKLYASYGLLLRPLEEILKVFKTFLGDHKDEVIMVSIKKAKNTGTINEEYLKPLLEEQHDASKVPGEMVHTLMRDTLEDLIVDYTQLSKLDNVVNMLNPIIRDLVKLNARVMYYWEGQQVLCYDLASCKKTPGWIPMPKELQDLPFAFGPPLRPRDRNKYFSNATKIIDPGCIHSSWAQTRTSMPDKLVEFLEIFMSRLRESVMRPPLTNCFPPLTPIPVPGDPPLLYEANAFISLTPKAQTMQQNLFKDKSEIWRRGEAYTESSDAEHVNYMLLAWLMAKGNAKLFLKPNFVLMDFVHPVVIERIIHNVQQRIDCGFALFCKDSGSCWAKTLLSVTTDNLSGERTDKCRPEAHALYELEVEAGMYPEIIKKRVMYALAIIPCALLIVGYFAGCHFSGNRVCPSIVTDKDRMHLKWAKRPPPAPQGEAQAAGDNTAAAPADAQQAAPENAEAPAQ